MAKRVQERTTYLQKVWQTVGVVALLVSVILVARVAFNVLLMILAGSLIATFFHGLADLIQRRIKWKRPVAMLAGVAVTFVVAGGLIWFMGTSIQQQIKQLSDTLPNTVQHLKVSLAKSDLGQKILDATGGDKNTDNMLDTARSFFTTTFGVLGDVYIILFLGIFFTTNPDLYKNGLLLLVPPSRKEVSRHILNRISTSLKGWLKGMMVAMVLVTVMITTGLYVIGIPAAMVLGLLTGLLEIVPTLGSAIAMIPGVLLGLTVDLHTAIFVALVYIVANDLLQYRQPAHPKKNDESAARADAG